MDIEKLKGLREHYPDDNPIALALDELIKDLESGETREETIADAVRAAELAGPGSAAYNLIGTVIAELNALPVEEPK